ncbi:hypothetical protein C8R42DRAFT_540393, partial [Lentinula raphanica]
AHWTLQDVLATIAFLKNHISSAGDGNKFKPAVYRSAADHLNERIIKEGCKKWKGLLRIYKAVDYLKNYTSGLHWDDHLSMNVGPSEESIWEDIITAHPDCIPFKGSGWEIFDDVGELRPEKAKGSH